MITLDTAKKHLRVDDDSEDALITTLISASYKFCENFTNRKIVQASETLILDSFDHVITMPFLPVDSIVSITYFDTNDVQQTLSDYYLNTRGLFATLEPLNGQVFPFTNEDYENVVITYQVGYSSIPIEIDQAALLILGSLFEQRENHIIGVSINNIPINAEYLLNAYKVVTV